MHDDSLSEADLCGGSRAAPGLVVALRRAARRERPLHDDGLEQRILRAVGVVPAAGRRNRFGRRSAAAGMGFAVAAAASVILCWSPGLVGRLPSLSTVEAVAFEELPLPDELGAQLVAETAAVAAEVVGLPRWNDLVTAGSFGAEEDTTP